MQKSMKSSLIKVLLRSIFEKYVLVTFYSPPQMNPSLFYEKYSYRFHRWRNQVTKTPFFDKFSIRSTSRGYCEVPESEIRRKALINIVALLSPNKPELKLVESDMICTYYSTFGKSTHFRVIK